MTPELFNSWRVFPRLFGLLFGLLAWDVADWYMGLADPSNGQSGFATGVLATSAAYFKLYVESGNK